MLCLLGAASACCHPPHHYLEVSFLALSLRMFLLLFVQLVVCLRGLWGCFFVVSLVFPRGPPHVFGQHPALLPYAAFLFVSVSLRNLH